MTLTSFSRNEMTGYIQLLYSKFLTQAALQVSDDIRNEELLCFSQCTKGDSHDTQLHFTRSPSSFLPTTNKQAPQ